MLRPLYDWTIRLAGRKTAEAWLATAQDHPGSWWVDWVAWLNERCGNLRAAPAVATAKYPKLADAAAAVRLSERQLRTRRKRLKPEA